MKESYIDDEGGELREWNPWRRGNATEWLASNTRRLE